MMSLRREPSNATTTLGELSFMGEELCDTLEDVVRLGDDGVMQASEKIYGQTAIPAGTYEVILQKWDKYHCKMPLLLNVPFYSGIFIHPGTTSADSLGCIIVGERQGPNTVINSQLTFFKKVLPRIHDYLDTNQRLYLEILNA